MAAPTKQEILNEKMNLLENYVDEDLHISQPSKVANLIADIHQSYTQLEYEDQQYVDVIDDMINRQNRAKGMLH